MTGNPFVLGYCLQTICQPTATVSRLGGVHDLVFRARKLFSRLALVTIYLLRVLIDLFECLRLMRVISLGLGLRLLLVLKIVLLHNT